MVVVDGQGLPLGNHLHRASPAEVRLAEVTLATIRVPARGRSGRPRQKPERVIADKGYDSDPLRRRLQRRRIEVTCPHKGGRVCPPTQDGRRLRRYQRRWIIERTIVWLGNFRRLVEVQASELFGRRHGFLAHPLIKYPVVVVGFPAGHQVSIRPRDLLADTFDPRIIQLALRFEF
ncbi:MAG: transposase [Candidatus Acidoferrales bacterium]